MNEEHNEEIRRRCDEIQYLVGQAKYLQEQKEWVLWRKVAAKTKDLMEELATFLDEIGERDQAREAREHCMLTELVLRTIDEGGLEQNE